MIYNITIQFFINNLESESIKETCNGEISNLKEIIRIDINELNQKQEVFNEKILERIESYEKQTNTELKGAQNAIKTNYNKHNQDLVFMGDLILEFTMKIKSEARKSKVPDDILQQCINSALRNNNIENKISWFNEEFEILDRIYNLVNKDTCEIDFWDKEGNIF